MPAFVFCVEFGEPDFCLSDFAVYEVVAFVPVGFSFEDLACHEDGLWDAWARGIVQFGVDEADDFLDDIVFEFIDVVSGHEVSDDAEEDEAEDEGEDEMDGLHCKWAYEEEGEDHDGEKDAYAGDDDFLQDVAAFVFEGFELWF